MFSRSFLDEMVRESGDIDVHVIMGTSAQSLTPSRHVVRKPVRRHVPAYLGATVAVVVSTVLSAFLFGPQQPADVVMTFLLGIVLVSMRFGYAPSLVAALLSVASFDFFFIPPYYSFAVADMRHIVTFAVMFFVAVLISKLTQQVRKQAQTARTRERHTAALYAMSRTLAGAPSTDQLIENALQQLNETFEGRSVVLLPDASERLSTRMDTGGSASLDGEERDVADWVWQHQRPAGLGTETFSSAQANYLPLQASRGRVGVLSIRPSHPLRFLDPEQRHLLESFANQLALALERARFAEEKKSAQLQVETEKLRNSLLSSVSHDLRTPLAVMMTASSALVEDHQLLSTAAKVDLAQTVYEESRRMNLLVRNLLEMTRLEAGAIQVTKDWQPFEEIVGAVLNRMEERLADRPVMTRVPHDLPLVPFDAILLEQVLLNLIENALRYTPPRSPLEIGATLQEDAVLVEVIDHGCGVPPNELERIFDKFHRLVPAGTSGGSGLGLTLCRGIILAHGGRMWADNNAAGGLTVRFTLPLEGGAPLELLEPESLEIAPT